MNNDIVEIIPLKISIVNHSVYFFDKRNVITSCKSEIQTNILLCKIIVRCLPYEWGMVKSLNNISPPYT